MHIYTKPPTFVVVLLQCCLSNHRTHTVQYSTSYIRTHTHAIYTLPPEEHHIKHTQKKKSTVYDTDNHHHHHHRDPPNTHTIWSILLSSSFRSRYNHNHYHNLHHHYHNHRHECIGILGRYPAIPATQISSNIDKYPSPTNHRFINVMEPQLCSDCRIVTHRDRDHDHHCYSRFTVLWRIEYWDSSSSSSSICICRTSAVVGMMSDNHDNHDNHDYLVVVVVVVVVVVLLVSWCGDACACACCGRSGDEFSQCSCFVVTFIRTLLHRQKGQ